MTNPTPDAEKVEQLEAVIKYIHQELVKCDRATNWEEKQRYLKNAEYAALDGRDAYPSILENPEIYP